jgi:hypothetical protein
LIGALRPAEKLLQSLGVTSPEEIDVEAVAWHLGAKVNYRPLKRCEARIVGIGNRAIISVDDRKSAERQKFSVCHELGHWHHHRGRRLDCRVEEIGSHVHTAVSDPERVANSYAADLLLPRYLVAPLANQVAKWNLAQVRAVAAAFGASVTATAIRLVEMDMIPGMIVCHRKSGRRWFARGPSVPTKWFPRNELDAESQAFTMLYGRDAELRFPMTIGADAWFDTSGSDRHEVKEQSFLLPNDDVATLLLLSAKMLD